MWFNVHFQIDCCYLNVYEVFTTSFWVEYKRKRVLMTIVKCEVGYPKYHHYHCDGNKLSIIQHCHEIIDDMLKYFYYLIGISHINLLSNNLLTNELD